LNVFQQIRIGQILIYKIRIRQKRISVGSITSRLCHRLALFYFIFLHNAKHQCFNHSTLTHSVNVKERVILRPLGEQTAVKTSHCVHRSVLCCWCGGQWSVLCCHMFRYQLFLQLRQDVMTGRSVQSVLQQLTK